MGQEVSRYVDGAMFDAEPIPTEAIHHPVITVLNATPDPLGSVAAMSMMYEGRVVRDLSKITDSERRYYYGECFRTTLKTPLEAIDFHLMVEGVTRAHTHQEVRQRTAVFAQESMRFAVKNGKDLRNNVRHGPSINTPSRVNKYYELIDRIGEVYDWLIQDGVPAEDARGLLPHDTLTRMHHKVNLRNLMDEIGKRLCTQAQFQWKSWAASLRQAIAEYATLPRYSIKMERLDNWQFEYIANSPLFVPICFNTGQCMFKSDQDRGCTIRDRVEAGRFDEIRTEEWAADPQAAWIR